MKKRKSNFIGAVIEFGTEPLFLTITTLVTVIFGILVNLVEPDSTLYRICDRGFFISMSLILVQVMLQQTEIKQESAAIYTKISSQDNVIFSDEKAKINEMFEAALRNPAADVVQIICYGTNAYGKYIEHIIQQCEHIRQLDVIMCCPTSPLLAGHDMDKMKIANTLKELQEMVSDYNQKQKRKSKQKKLNLYCANVVPTVRASMVYDEDLKPIWCTMQFYRMYHGDGTMMRGEGLTPAFVAANTYSPILDKLSRAFTEEFERLKKCGTLYGGAVAEDSPKA